MEINKLFGQLIFIILSIPNRMNRIPINDFFSMVSFVLRIQPQGNPKLANRWIYELFFGSWAFLSN